MAIRKVIPRSLDSAAASANLSFDANTLYVDSTNNVVGINTATPNSFATGLAVYNATNPSVAIVSGNANSYLRLYSTSDSDMYLSNIGGTMTFSTAATSRMTINSSGNVSIVGNASIGTTSPTPLVGAGKYLTLSNNSNATLSIQAVDGGNDRNATLELLASGNGVSYSQIVYGDTDITPGSPSPLIFTGYHSGTATERMRLTATGNLGIGISPSYRLDVSLGGATAGIVDTARFYADASAGAEARILFGSFANAVSSAIGAQSDSGTTGILKFYTDTAGSLTEKMRIENGQVGIGTTATIGNAYLNVNQGVVARTAAASSVTPYFQLYNGNATTDLKTWRIGGNTDGSLGIESVNDAYNSSTERMRITSVGVIELPFGKLKFPSTQSASSDANTLDDYEEGTYSPNLSFTSSLTGSFTFTRNTARYVKVGRLVHIQGWVAWSAKPSAGNTLSMALPFSSESGDDPRGGIQIAYADAPFNGLTIYHWAFRTENGTALLIANYRNDAVSGVMNNSINVGSVNANATFMFSGTYFTNA